MSKSHEIPEWRHGAFYWRPLLDGREITIYPLLFGAARLCVGPLADEGGYDMAFRYEQHSDAIAAADEWDPEEQNMPEGFTVIETKKDDEDEAPKVGAFEKVKADDNFTIQKPEHGKSRVNVTRLGKRGRIMFAGTEHRDVDEALVVEIDTVSFERYDGAAGAPEGQSTIVELADAGWVNFKAVTNDGVTMEQKVDEQAQWPHPDNNPDSS